MYVFFFFKQKTAYEMRISDWSSDVCSSDLADELLELLAHLALGAGLAPHHGVGGIANHGEDVFIGERLQPLLVISLADQRRGVELPVAGVQHGAGGGAEDRKSTRLNSSH